MQLAQAYTLLKRSAIVAGEAEWCWTHHAASDHMAEQDSDMAERSLPYDGPIVTRSEAKARGLTTFFTGRPCQKGHIDERRTASGCCVTCGNAATRARYRADPAKHIAAVIASSKKHIERRRQTDKDYHERHKERRNAAHREWAAANEDKLIEYRKANVDKIRETRARHRIKNAERLAEYGKEYRAKNKELINWHTRKRRALRLSAGGTHTQQDIDEILKAQRGKCAYCRAKLGSQFHVDHIVPLSAGGSDARSNLQCTCASCNRRKNSKRPEEFARIIGLLI